MVKQQLIVCQETDYEQLSVHPQQMAETKIFNTSLKRTHWFVLE